MPTNGILVKQTIWNIGFLITVIWFQVFLSDTDSFQIIGVLCMPEHSKWNNTSIDWLILMACQPIQSYFLLIG